MYHSISHRIRARTQCTHELAGFKEPEQFLGAMPAEVLIVTFKPLENVFTPGYLPMKRYVGSIDDSYLCKKSRV